MGTLRARPTFTLVQLPIRLQTWPRLQAGSRAAVHGGFQTVTFAELFALWPRAKVVRLDKLDRAARRADLQDRFGKPA